MPKLSFWVGEDDAGLIKALDKLQKGFHEKGIPMSKSALVVAILKKGIRVYAEEADRSISEGIPMAD